MKKRKSFTLIELSIVVAIIGILATGIVVAIQPKARFAQMRDMKRRADLERIYSAIQNKALSEEGAWTDCGEIPFEPTHIGKGEGNYDLYHCLVPKYLSTEIYDPKNGTSDDSGYEIWKTGLGEVGLRANREYPSSGYIIIGALPNLPVVTTIEPTNITSVSADTGGDIHYEGDSPVTERGIVWDTMPHPTIQDNKITSGSGAGEFNITIDNLEPENTYYVRAYAINDMGNSYGQEYSFQTKTPTVPIVKTQDASDIKVHSATLNGKIFSLGVYNSVEAYFKYRKKGESNWPLQTSKISVGQSGNFSQPISGLDEKTNYEFKFVAEYTDGTAEGNPLEFTTLSANPIIETKPADNITWNSATLHGTLDSLGIYSSVSVYFLHRKTGQESWTMDGPLTKTAPSDFSISVSGLDDSTQYEFKAAAEDSSGNISEGDVLNFSTTQIPPPKVETSDASFNIQPGIFETTLKGNLTDLGGYSSVDGYFRYQKKGDTTWQYTQKSPLTNTGYFTQNINNLNLNTTYKFEASVDYNNGETVYGGSSEFTTPTGDVKVTTDEIGDLSAHEATLNGTLDSLGVYTKANVYFKFHKLGDDTWYETQKPEMTDTGTFSATINNLESTATYEFQALADYDNGNKTAEGYIKQFATPKAEVKVSTSDATNITVDSATLNGSLVDFGDYSSPVKIYFGYGTSPASDYSGWQFYTDKKDENSLGDFSTSISGLNINTTYYFQALADYDNGNKTAEGDIKNFPTPKEGAKIETLEASNTESTSTELNGKITYFYGYGSLDAYFQYRKAGDTSWSQTEPQTLYGTESFSYPLSGLEEGTDYEFRAGASYGNNIKIYGETLSFSTLNLVKIETQNPSGVTTSKATLNGDVTSLGSFSSADVYFKYRKSGSTSWSETTPITITNTGSFSRDLTGLPSNTTYEFKAIAEYQNQSTGKNYISEGSLKTFTTSKIPVSVETLNLDNNDYTANTATLRGKIIDLGDYSSADVYFRFKQASTPWYQTDSAAIYTAPREFSVDIPEGYLSPNTETQYQAIAGYNNGEISQGDVLTFTTDPKEFRVKTDPATNVELSSATLHGEITSLGTSHSGTVYFKYKKSTDTSWTTITVGNFSTKTSFSTNINGLSGNTTYDFKATADSWEGSTLQFTTKKAPTVSTLDADNITVNSARLKGNLTDLGSFSSADVYFKYRKTGSTSWLETTPTTMTSTGSFSKDLTGLPSNTPYEFKAVANYDSHASEGSQKSFTTSGIDGDPYRKPIIIDNSGNSSNLSSYQILVILNTYELIQAGKMSSDCGDVRFADSDGSTKLDYWIESGCNSTSTRIWVEVPSIPASSIKTIYIYYGNLNLSSESNGGSTFLSFDDFSTDTSGQYHKTTWNNGDDAWYRNISTQSSIKVRWKTKFAVLGGIPVVGIIHGLTENTTSANTASQNVAGFYYKVDKNNNLPGSSSTSCSAWLQVGDNGNYLSKNYVSGGLASGNTYIFQLNLKNNSYVQGQIWDSSLNRIYNYSTSNPLVIPDNFTKKWCFHDYNSTSSDSRSSLSWNSSSKTLEENTSDVPHLAATTMPYASIGYLLTYNPIPHPITGSLITTDMDWFFIAKYTSNEPGISIGPEE